MFLVDTNVLLHAANPHSPEHAVCRGFVEQASTRSLPWYTTWGIIYEFLRVSTHRRAFKKPRSIGDAWGWVDALLSSPGLTVLVETARHPEVARLVLREVPALSGNVLHDAHTAILMREHGIRRIYTRDMDFHRFPFLEVIDPLAAPGTGT